MPIPFFHIYCEFENIPRYGLKLPVRYYSREKEKLDPDNPFCYLTGENFRCWEYQIFSKLNRFDFKTIGMRFCELARCRLLNSAK